MINLFLVRRKLINFDEDVRENDLYIFVSNDLDLSPLDLKFARVVALVPVQRCVSTKLEISTGFFFGENRKHGTDRHTNRLTDGWTEFNA